MPRMWASLVGSDTVQEFKNQPGKTSLASVWFRLLTLRGVESPFRMLEPQAITTGLLRFTQTRRPIFLFFIILNSSSVIYKESLIS